MATQLISPFSFLVWKEDKQELVAGTSDTTLGYMVLLTVDGVDVEDIVKYMKDQEDERWHDTVARNWPTYVKAVASAAGKPTFLDTGKCDVEYADINTGEVLEITLPATAASYQEAVRVETARSQHEMSARTKKRSKQCAATQHKSRGKKQATGSSSNSKKLDAEQDASGDWYDDDETDEDEEAEDEDDCMEEMNTMRVIAAQMEATILLAAGMGLTENEIKNVYASVVSRNSIPKSVEECAAVAERHPLLQQYMHNFTSRARESGVNKP